jgi:chromosome segregation ATPase
MYSCDSEYKEELEYRINKLEDGISEIEGRLIEIENKIDDFENKINELENTVNLIIDYIENANYRIEDLEDKSYYRY